MSISELQIAFTKDLPSILFTRNCSIILSTYQAGRVITLGSKNGVKLNQVSFQFNKPMGIALQDAKLAIAALDEVHFFSDKGNIHRQNRFIDKDYDKVYLQRAQFHTSRLDIHDIEFGKGNLWGVNTAFSCLCKFGINYSFAPKWKPDFISELAPEDRCHLNGLAMEEGLPKYVTALSQTNVKKGWREDIMNSGILMEVPSSRIILDKLAMPHSPRIINGDLYLLESGNGDLIKVDCENGTKEIIYSFNRFVRGLSHIDDLLFIGASKIRPTSKIFNNLEVKENSLLAGVIVFDLKKREIVASLEYQNKIEEIFDVQVIPEANKTAIIDNDSEYLKEIITTPVGTFWKKQEE